MKHPHLNLRKTCLGMAAAIAAISASGQSIGPSTTNAPYVEPMTPNVAITSLFTVGDSVNFKPDGVTPYRMVGIPDGLGAFDNHDGTFTLLMNHELGTSAGVVRAHGAKGSFVSKWIVNKATLAVNHVSDLSTNVFLFDTNTYSYVSAMPALGRLCSADLPLITAFYNPATGKGTTNRIFMNGEESAPANARAFAFIVTGPEANTSYELPWLGKMNWENSMACPTPQDKTIVACLDDDGITDSQLYFYIGTKTNSGMEIVKAGLSGGNLYAVSVSGLSLEVAGTTAVTRNFSLVNLSAVTDIVTANANQLEQAGNTNGVTAFMRIEDGMWDPTHPNDFYFVTTASTVLPSRLWRLRFNSVAQPELGGVLDMMLDGTEGQVMFDNMEADSNGNIVLTEDPGNNARLARLWKYNPATDILAPLAQSKTNFFITGQPNFLTQDEEQSGIVDVSEILGAGKYLFVTQIHNSSAYAGDLELAEGGQLCLLQTQFQSQSTGPSTVLAPYTETIIPDVAITSLFGVGESVNNKPDGVTPYRMVGIPDGLGAFDNGNGTFTVLMNHELGTSAGVARLHGGKGAFVSRWIINKASLTVQSISDQMDKYVYLFDTNSYSYYIGTNVVFGRFCSADLPAATGFYNAATGNGTTNRIFMNGEESAPANARAVAHIVTGGDIGTSWELPWLGKMNWENAVTCPTAQEKTIVACMDDDGTTDSQLYLYIGTKTNSGLDIVKAGLANGSLYGVSVSGMSLETTGTLPTTRNFSLVNLSVLGDVTILNANQLEQLGNTNGVSAFMRIEDGMWDPTHSNDFYFVTTASTSLPSRLWRLRFANVTQPELGGVIDMMLDGTEGQVMFDNMEVDAFGNVLLTEDPGNNVRLARLWKYYPTTDSLVPLVQSRPTYFITGQPNFLTQDEEHSGIVDVSSILGAGKYLFVTQIHNSSAYAADPELAEGGQLALLEIFSSIGSESLITGQPQNTSVGIGGNAGLTVTVPPGSWVQWYFNGRPVPGGTNATLNIGSVTANNVGSYYAVVGNSSGSVVSGTAILSTTSISLYAGITINGPVGSVFKVQYTTDLSGTPVWTDLANVVLSSPSTTYFDTTPAVQGQRYYRALLQQ
ncbi:MAG: immunoglobulin domain-containing protein [Akkermansiaceae bacterium]|nr:immunoglobulin domain-containing protein [Verrucomicrobiales bacterium]